MELYKVLGVYAVAFISALCYFHVYRRSDHHEKNKHTYDEEVCILCGGCGWGRGCGVWLLRFVWVLPYEVVNESRCREER